ncbi:hypothetical protein S40293_09216 [Stachybotrys chartarum IBT 40293]|nr:hypothetical protein S40293_09216 [Stachybotrys chartarum IBT 40293]
MLQPLDTAVNKPFKKWLQDATEEYVAAREAKGLTEWSVSDKRIMITWAVAKAAKYLQNRPELIQQAFIQCGISIRPDGSEDSLIRIKDIPIEAIDLSGWKEQEEAIIKDEALVDEIEDDNQIIVAGDDEDDVYIGLLGCNVLQPKEMLREARLPVSGLKDVLIARLQAFYHEKQRNREVFC